MTAGGLVRLDGGRRSLVSLLVLAGAASAAGWPCARHRRSGAEAARHARNGWCEMPFQTARCRIVGCTTAPKLRGGPEPRMAIAALAGRERTGPARERAVASGTAVARAADARHGARARCCWAQRIDEARQRYRFCLDERPTAVADAAVVGGAGCWVLGEAGRAANQPASRALAALRAALDLDALPA
jgi:hypothetical protein